MSKSFSERIGYALQMILGGREYRDEGLRMQARQRELIALREWFTEEMIAQLPDASEIKEINKEYQRLSAELKERYNRGEESRGITIVEAEGIEIEAKRRVLEEMGLDIASYVEEGVTLRDDRYYRHRYYQQGVTYDVEVRDAIPEITYNNLPQVSEPISQRLTTAIGVIMNSEAYRATEDEQEGIQADLEKYRAYADRYNSIRNLEYVRHNLQRLDNDLIIIERAQKDIEGLKRAISKATRAAYGEHEPEYKAHTKLILEKALETISGEMDMLNSAQYGETEYEKEYNILQGKIMAVIMMYAETLNNAELESAQIGKVSLKTFLASIPELIGAVDKKDPSKIIASSSVRLAITGQYYKTAYRLSLAGVIEDKSPHMDQHNMPDLDLREDQDGLEVLLNRYCGTKLETTTNRIGSIYRHFNVKKNPEPSKDLTAEQVKTVSVKIPWEVEVREEEDGEVEL